MKAIRIERVGGPEVLKLADVPTAEPSANQVLIRHRAIGVNFIDVYHRTGLYKLNLPFTPGMEGSGVVEAVGPDASGVQPGDRVAYAMALGSYSEYALVPAHQIVPLPPTLSFELGAAALLQGMTAHYLTESSYPVKQGDSVLVHAAAGGAGLLVVQMAKRRGARVFGTVSTPAKAGLAQQAGADEVILYTQEDFESEVKRLTDGKGVQVVYDSVGRTTFEKSLNCLAPRGVLVLFGQSSGPVPPVDPGTLMGKGSLFLTRPTLAHYSASRDELLWRAGDLFSWMDSGEVKVRIGQVLPLADASEAHRRLEGRQTSGKLLLVP
ncbi:MAG: quinone oxidoreductase [Acidobacteriota bacterium]